MKNVKINNNSKKKTSSVPKNLNNNNSNNNNKNLNQNNIYNEKENNKVIKKPAQENNDKDKDNINKNDKDKEAINKQKNIKEIKAKDQKDNNKNKETEQKSNKNSNNNDSNNINIEDNNTKKIFSYDLKLTNDELKKIMTNNIIFPKTSKLIKSQSHDNIYKYNEEKSSLDKLTKKQKYFYDLINAINSEKKYLNECSLNNLSERNLIYKNIQNELMKKLDDKENNFRDRISLIQQEIKDINIKKLIQIKTNEHTDKQRNKNKIDKEYNSKLKEFKIQRQKLNENFKNAEINYEKNLNNLLLLEKDQLEKKKVELLEKIKQTHSLEKKHFQKINIEAEKNKKYIKSNKKRGSTGNYLYFKLEKSFEEKEKEFLSNIRKIKNTKENDKNKEEEKDKERKEYLDKKKKEMMENVINLHKIWKERNNKLPKYISPTYEKALNSEEGSKKHQNDKKERKKLLYINKENYAKEKIPLPPINNLLKKENLKKETNNRKKRNKLNDLQLMKLNSLKESSTFKSQSTISLQNIQNNQKQNGNKIIINISLKKEQKNELKSPNNFNYLKQLRKERILKSNSEKYLLSKKNKTDNPEIDLEKEKQNLDLLEKKYNMGKKLLRIKGGYMNDLELGNQMNKLLVKSIDKKLDIIENITNNNLNI